MNETPRRWRDLAAGVHPHLRSVLIFVALIATVLVPIVLGGSASLRAALAFPPLGYAAIFALVGLSWIARALKLQLLLQRMQVPAGLVSLLGISLATDFAFMVTPAGVGGYAASVYYLRRTGISTTQATAITAADQGLDIFFFVFALPLAALALVWTAPLERLGALAFGAGAAMLLALTVALLFRRRIAGWLFRPRRTAAPGSRRRRIQDALRRFIARLRADSRPLLAGGPRFVAGTLVLTTLQQLPRYGVLWTVLVFLGHPVSFVLTFLLQTFVLQAASWTGIPSGGGAAELGLSAALAPWVDRQDMASILLVWRVATLYVGLLAGALAIVLLSRRGAAVATATAQEPQPPLAG